MTRRRDAATHEGGAFTAGFNGWKSVSGSIQYSEGRSPTIEANMPPDVVLAVDENQRDEIRVGRNMGVLTTGGGRPGQGIPCVIRPAYCIQGNCIDRADTAGCNGKGWAEEVCYTLNTIDRPAVTQPVPLLNDQDGSAVSGDDAASVCPTLRAEMHGNVPAVVQSAGFLGQNSATARGIGYEEETAPTIRVGLIPDVLESRPNGCHTFAQNGFRGDYTESDTGPTLKQRDYKDATDLVVTRDARSDYVIRRLTPLECERLQGFPDHWTDIGPWTGTDGRPRKESSDAARYRALGNSIALPPWTYILQRLSLACGPDRTMASLFDGIGGFPLIWEGLNGPGSCLWASEIEEFPIAVTERRFNGGKNG